MIQCFTAPVQPDQCNRHRRGSSEMHPACRYRHSTISIGSSTAGQPYAYKDGHYSPIDEYQYNDKEPIGVHLVFEHPQPVVGGSLWILNPDLVVALHLIKEGDNWVRPQENFLVVARELWDADGKYRLIEIRREHLMDYLAARAMALRISYYRQRVVNVPGLDGSAFDGMESYEEERDGGRFELLIRTLEQIHGGSWSAVRVWWAC